MIKKYYEFINESFELLLESNVVFSENFKKILSKINNPVADAILKIENQDYDVTSNFFDISPKNDTVTFIQDKKAQKIIGDKKEVVRFTGHDGGWLKHKPTNNNLFAKLGYSYDEGQEPYRPGTTDVGEVVAKVTSEQSGKTYAWVKFKNTNGEDVGEGVYNVERLREAGTNKINQVWQKNRQEVKIGRAVQALLKSAGIEEFKPKNIEEFVNLYKSTIDKLNDKFSYFEVVRGKDIAYWYDRVNYFKTSGTLGGSCMGGCPEHFFEIYTKNPNQVGLVIFKSPEDPEKIIGRALLWTLNDGKIFLDRIYTVHDSDVKLYREYAKTNGWYSKYNNSSTDNGESYTPDGDDTVTLELSVDLENYRISSFPYLDTLKYFNPRNGNISNMEDKDCYLLEDTEGSYVRECDRCGGRGRVECPECGGNGEVECGNCDGSGEVEDREGNEEECDDCNGRGNVDCPECYGNGSVDCPECS